MKKLEFQEFFGLKLISKRGKYAFLAFQKRNCRGICPEILVFI